LTLLRPYFILKKFDEPVKIRQTLNEDIEQSLTERDGI